MIGELNPERVQDMNERGPMPANSVGPRIYLIKFLAEDPNARGLGGDPVPVDHDVLELVLGPLGRAPSEPSSPGRAVEADDPVLGRRDDAEPALVQTGGAGEVVGEEIHEDHPAPVLRHVELIEEVDVIARERCGDFLGQTVQVVPHITDAVQDWLEGPDGVSEAQERDWDLFFESISSLRPAAFRAVSPRPLVVHSLDCHDAAAAARLLVSAVGGGLRPLSG